MTSLLLLLLCFLFSCGQSLREYGSIYFKKGEKALGVEPYHSLKERLKEERSLQEVIYGQEKTKKIQMCTVLRNQLYVAMLHNPKGQAGQILKEAALAIEEAYQYSDELFLDVCGQVSSSNLGKEFLKVQLEH